MLSTREIEESTSPDQAFWLAGLRCTNIGVDTTRQRRSEKQGDVEDTQKQKQPNGGE